MPRPSVPQRSAGLLLYRRGEQGLELFLVHPGGPFFANKDEGAWSLPKGLIEGTEEPLRCAQREFVEETGQPLPAGPFHELGEVTLKGGKRVLAFAAEGDADPNTLKSNTFEMVWPPRSGRRQVFPEVDRAIWASPALARQKLNPAQAPLVDRLLDVLGAS